MSSKHPTVESVLDHIASELYDCDTSDLDNAVNSEPTYPVKALNKGATEIHFLVEKDLARIIYSKEVIGEIASTPDERLYVYRTKDNKGTFIIEFAATFPASQYLGACIAIFHNSLIMSRVIKWKGLTSSLHPQATITSESTVDITERDKKLLDQLDYAFQQMSLGDLVKKINSSGPGTLVAIYQGCNYIHLEFRGVVVIYCSERTQTTNIKYQIHRSLVGEWGISKVAYQSNQTLIEEFHRHLTTVLDLKHSKVKPPQQESVEKMKTIRVDIIDQETNETTSDRFDVVVKSSFTNHMIMLMIRGLLSQLK